MILYQIAEGGPFNLEVDNGVFIENITDDLVNAGILVPMGFSDKVLYMEPIERCDHIRCWGVDPCEDCGALQRWVVQVYPKEENNGK